MYSGEQFYVKVQGADTTAFSTGNYAMTLNFGNNASPTVPLPNTTVPNGNPLQAGGGQADWVPGQKHQHSADDFHPFHLRHPHGPAFVATTSARDHHHAKHSFM